MAGNKNESQARYMSRKKMITLVLDKDEDADIIRWLGKHGNRSGVIRELLKKEIEKR